ncbi:SDR family NAD(P)-dependent oxidoreductase [Streptomyces sp. TRM 70361]|uniref:SDR family NAD(P)-dependent oxidoreductase n=1 Tax=Streptomyces sp. TRM 70361 TaxID=3116553 RepID=UPI002E7B35A8|nr:SDR family NAD(P)-dependent oxidoreductase [Streptomyces sp. TRM 70361]MEE1942795.1 SDR family NAD(P)-dependent oxidoreductase [Streptomyces sp. TRM 70361]
MHDETAPTREPAAPPAPENHPDILPRPGFDPALFAGRTALVAGASSGIGAAVALELGRYGARVGLVSRDGAAMEKVAASVAEAGGQAVVAPADLADGPALAAAVRRCETELGPADFLVNSVVHATRQVFLCEQDEADWQRTLDINLTGTFRLCRLVVPGMMERRRGSIVLLSSTAGKRGLSSNTAYCAAKSGIIGFMRALAQELGPFGVRVNSVCPGLTDTPAVHDEDRYGRDFMASLRRHHGPADLTWERYVRRSVRGTALGRLLLVPEVTQQILCLLSDLSSGVTGSAVDVDAGAM